MPKLTGYPIGTKVQCTQNAHIAGYKTSPEYWTVQNGEHGIAINVPDSTMSDYMSGKGEYGNYYEVVNDVETPIITNESRLF